MLYPLLEPFDQGFLKVDDLHALFYEQSGNPAGVPVVFLHGGPGGGSAPKHRQFFDPAHYRIVIFDQRGAGKSTPLGELRQNTTHNLVEDIEKLRQHLGIQKWHVFGGSWGSTLALCYAIAHADRVISLTLRGIFLMRQQEIDFFLYGMKNFFPEAWDDFASLIPPEKRHNLLAEYHQRLTHPDEKIRMEAAKKWCLYEGRCVKLIPDPPSTEDTFDMNHAYAIARMECHYFVQNRFQPDDFILKNINKIRHIPAVIVQGRHDIVCPITTAHDLHKSWPEAKFIVVPDAGHSASEPGITAALIEATDGFRKI